jgi:ParB/RepB/Spo0J family partition protein
MSSPYLSPTLTPAQIDASLERPVYDQKAKREIPTYVLVQKPTSWLIPVAKDKRIRTGAEYQELLTRLVEDVKVRGVQQPIIAVAKGDAAQVVDGETRRIAALIAHCETVPICMYEKELSESDLVMAQLQSGALRQDFSDLDLAEMYHELMALNGWNQAQLARNIQAPASKVSKILAVSSNLCVEVREMGIAPRAAYQISRLTDVPMQIDFAKKVRDGIWSVEAVEQRVQSILSNGKRERKPKPWTVKAANATATIKGNLIEGIDALIAALKKKRNEGPDPLPA